MASINFNPFESWFRKPQNPIQPINLLSLAHSFRSKTFSSSPNFASINFSSPFNKKPKKPDSDSDTPGPYKQMLDQFFWECENLPDYRHTPEVEKILDEDPVFEKKEYPTERKLKRMKNGGVISGQVPWFSFWLELRKLLMRSIERSLKKMKSRSGRKIRNCGKRFHM